MDIKEIIIFSEQGNPREIKTWSNVPYFLVKTLEAKGIIVNTVDLSIQSVLQKVIRKIFNFYAINVLRQSFYDYSRSSICSFFIEMKVTRVLKKYKTADLSFFTTFSFPSTPIVKTPVFLFCDWTIEHYFDYFLERQPNYFESLSIERQNKVIENASGVFVLFPAIAGKMKSTFSNPNIFYNGNVVNNLINADDSIIEKKIIENDLLFVGSKKYLKGAFELISAFIFLKKEKYPDLRLHIIGMDQDDIDIVTDGIHFYGYLDKGIAAEANIYYNLLKKAKIFINTTPKWASFSASLEAMYFYTPLIITPYTEFTETFGNHIEFGSYYNPQNMLLSTVIDQMLSVENYKNLCIFAHHAAEKHTWKQYVDNMLITTSSIVNGYNTKHSERGNLKTN